MLCLGMLFLIDLRMLGFAMTNVPATSIAKRLNLPMLIGFSIMVITGIALVYAVPVSGPSVSDYSALMLAK